MREKPVFYFSTKSQVIALLSLVFLLTASVLWFAVHRDYQNTVNHASLILQRTAQSLEMRMERTIVASDLILQHIAESIQKIGIKGTVFSKEEWERFRLNAESLPDVGSLWLLDNDANLVLDSTEYPSKRVNFSEREYFKPQRDEAIESYVGPIVKGKITHKYSFTISRRISGEDGTFLGIVLVAIETDDFTNFLHNLSIGENASLAVFRTDGALIFRQPMKDEYLGHNFKELKLFSMPFGDSPSGIFESNSSMDRVERLVAYQKMQHFPLVVTTTVPIDSITKDWRTRARNYSVIGIIALFVVAGLSWLVLRSVSREETLRSGLEERVKERTRDLAEANAGLRMEVEQRKRAEEELHRSREGFRVTLSSIGDGVIATDASGLVTFINPVGAELTGWHLKESLGQPIQSIFKVINEETRKPAEDIVKRVLLEGSIVNLANHTALVTRDGREIPVEDSAAPIRDSASNLIGVVLVFHNVTEKRKAQDALRESEERFRRFYESGLLGVIFWNMDGAVTDANDKFLGMLGYDREDLAAGRIDWINMTPPEYRHLDEASVEELKATGVNNVPFEKEYIRKDGSRVPILMAGAMLDEALFNGVAFVLDITDRKLAEEALRESRAKLEAALASMTDAVFISDAEGRFINFNDAFASYHRFKNKEECLKTLSEYPDILDVFMDDGQLAPLDQWTVPRALRGETATNAEYTLRRKDTGETWVGSYSFGPIRDDDGRIVGSVVAGRDITERKHMEEELRRSHDELELRVQERTGELLRANEALGEQASLLDLAHDAILVRDLHDRIVYWSRGAEKTYGWTQDEARGKVTHDLLQTQFPGSSAEIGTRLLEEGRWEGELSHIARNGSRIIVESRQALQRNVDGEPRGILEINRDITESRNMEKQLTRVDRLSSMGVLAGGIAHEIRNPLHAMSLFLDVLTDGEKFTRTSQELDIFQEIKSSIKRIDGIIRRVRDFSRQSASISEKLEIGVLIEQSLELWKSKMSKNGIKLGLSVEENLPKVIGDHIEFQQVLTNLVQNAVEAMEENGALGIFAESGTFSIDKKRPAVIIKVEDSGPGIPLDQQKNIFTPFFTTKYSGTGLGLAISHRIISRCGGLLSFESVPGEGTTFTVELPVASGELK